MAFVALSFREIHKRLVWHSFDKTITQEIHGNAEGANVFGIRNVFLNFCRGKCCVGANGAVVDEGAPFDGFGTMVDGNIRIFKPATGTPMADAQFRYLTRAARGWVLMALAAGLRVVKRPEAIGDLFDLIELPLIHGVRGVVHHSVGLVVESSGRFRSGWSEKIGSKSEKGHTQEKFHEHLNVGVGRLNVTYARRKTKWKIGPVYERSVNRGTKTFSSWHSLFAETGATRGGETLRLPAAKPRKR